LSPRLTFTQIDPNNLNSKFSFEIGVENDTWSIINIQPVLIAEDTVEKCLSDFNETDDMTAFVCGMREAIRDQLAKSIRDNSPSN
jgi:Chromosome segregation protein Spc25